MLKVVSTCNVGLLARRFSSAVCIRQPFAVAQESPDYVPSLYADHEPRQEYQGKT
jgi:hypothetical protein